MYDSYIYASYALTFVPLALLIAFSFKQLAEARARLARVEAASKTETKAG